jgi:hypothetical protein
MSQPMYFKGRDDFSLIERASLTCWNEESLPCFRVGAFAVFLSLESLRAFASLVLAGSLFRSKASKIASLLYSSFPIFTCFVVGGLPLAVGVSFDAEPRP